MSELDAVVDRCRREEPFTSGIVRDTSNRSGRDWPWWSVEIEHTEEDAPERRRVTATVRLSSTQRGEPDSFAAEWLARIWQGESVDSFREKGGWPLTWKGVPTPQQLQETMIALLEQGDAAIEQALTDRRRAT